MAVCAVAPVLVLPENRAAFDALERLLLGLNAETDASLPSLVYLHGPTGTGKTTLIDFFRTEADDLGLDVLVLSANALADVETLPDADVLVIEDLQHLPDRATQTMIALLEERQRCGLPMFVTADRGPANLTHRGQALPNRLTNRLIAGLVVALKPLQPSSRRRLLGAFADAEQITIADEILDWLAKNLTAGGRQLHAAVRQLAALQRLQAKPLRLPDVKAHFRAQVEAQTTSVERIAERVSTCFRVSMKQMRSPARAKEIVLPRQVSMYLVRQLTGMTLENIGKYFGGRDHKTVLYACDKIEAVLKSDIALSSTIGQLEAELR